MSNDDLNAAYQRISGRFPAEWPVEIMAQANFGRRRVRGSIHLEMFGVDTIDYSLHVTAGGVDYVEVDVDLDDIEAAADAIIEQIAAADMADPVRSRRGLDRLAGAVESAPDQLETPSARRERKAQESARAVLATPYADAPASGGTGRAA